MRWGWRGWRRRTVPRTGSRAAASTQPTPGAGTFAKPFTRPQPGSHAGAPTRTGTTQPGRGGGRALPAAGRAGCPPRRDRRRRAQGIAPWLDAQLARPPEGSSRYDWMVAKGYAVEANSNNFNGADAAIWRKLLTATDPVRQRMALALSEILVVSMNGLPIPWRGLAIAHYADLLEQHAFGSYRQLLEAVTFSVPMGSYLNLRGNRKEDPTTGRVPDENYAREVMQLFSIGLLLLNPDGTPQRVGGQPVESYTQADITQLARVFTGWDSNRAGNDDYEYVKRPMIHVASRFAAGDKSVLGKTIPASADGPAALQQALDILANHPNVGPFIGRQLIQRFTQSHPSPAYVARVAAAFNDNGRGQRGDLKATLRAVLLDPEARAAPSGVQGGRLREPVLRFVQWARTLGLSSPGDLWAIGDTSDPATRLGQSPFRSPTVFNFFRPGYVPSGGPLAAQAVTVPEFQLLNESSIAGYLNTMQNWITNGVGDLRPDVSALIPLAADGPALLAALNLHLAANAIPGAVLSQLATAVGQISAGTDSGKLARVRAAQLLVLASPDYLIQQ
ncbi:MAG: DUF1800 domain-containing protein [Inhella sp.]